MSTSKFTYEDEGWPANGHAIISRSERIADILYQQITRHELAEGARLPSENALAGHFGVSRAVVREAIARLKARGLIETVQGSGAYVRKPQAISDHELDGPMRATLKPLLDLIEVRRSTESEIAALAAASHTPQQMATIRRALDRLDRATARGEDGVREDCAFHASIADASGNIYWQKLTEALSRSVTTALRVTRGNEAQRPEFAAQVISEHAAIVEGIASRDPERARAAASAHMERAIERVMNADKTFWQQDGAVIAELAAPGKAD